MESILIIDDEEDIRELLSYNLGKEGYKVYTAPNGPEGIKIAKKHIPDLILLDVMMPEMDGIEVCERLRSDDKTQDITICFLTARSEDYSQIAGLEAGADDYVAKPIKPKVLISRIKALLRRGKNAVDENSSSLGLIVDVEKHEVVMNGESLHLPRKEFKLLHLLFTSPDKVFDRDTILQEVWGGDVIVGDRTIDVHIRKLREKIGGEYIKTVKGVGYKFVRN